MDTLGGDKMGAAVREALELAEKQFAQYEELVKLAKLASETQARVKAVRDVSYPVGFVIDKKAVNGFLG